MPQARIKRGFLALILILVGCTGLRRLEPQVSTRVVDGAALRSPAACYRWAAARAGDPQQAALQTWADDALARAGLPACAHTANPDATPWLASVELAQRVEVPPPHWGWFGAAGDDGTLFPGLGRVPNHIRQVTLRLQHPDTSALMLQTQARLESPWRDTEPVVRALLQAALDGYPNPPAGERVVPLEIPR